MRFCIETLGCKVNQFESQALITMLTERGHTLVPSSAEFDACIVNTCAVTTESVRKSRQTARRLKGRTPGAFLAVCGCSSQLDPVAARLLGADLVGGSGDRVKFADDLERLFENRLDEISAANPSLNSCFESLPASGSGGRTRAFLKIQDGCDNYCSYCVIPFARGHCRSLPVTDAAKAAAGLCDEGYAEIVITGIEISSYGKDFRDGTGLADVLEAIHASAAGARVRLGSLEPRTITEDFCKRLSALDRICGHFHLSLQSGCDSTLLRMNRKYTTGEFLKSVNLLRQYFPNCGLTTDLIAGFPGETAEEFSDTLGFMEKCAFSGMHIFPYSAHDITASFKLENKLPRAVKQERTKAAAQIAAKMKLDFLQAQVGKTLSVLFEEEKDGFSSGHAENYVRALVRGTVPRNAVLNIQITSVEDDSVLGEIVTA